MESVIAKFEALLQNEDFRQIQEGVRAIRSEFVKIVRTKNEEALKLFTSEGGDSENFVNPIDPLEEKFESLFVVYNEKKEAYHVERQEAAARKAEIVRQKKEADAKVLIEKRTLVDEITAFVTEVVKTGDLSQENFNKFKGIQDRWNASGRVSFAIDQVKDLQGHYNHQVDIYFHNRKLDREMQSLGYVRNLEDKKKILEKMKVLAEEESVAKLASTMREYQAEWNKVGPVAWEDKDEINNGFKELADNIYGRVKEHYDSRRGEMRENLGKKIQLCEIINEINRVDRTAHSDWQESTEIVLKTQTDWKDIGYCEENETVWQVFRTACDTFFESKKAFYSKLDKVREEAKVKKIELCEKAEELKHSTEWKQTTDVLINLQRKWKEVGSARRSEENKLWDRFRSACDTFFDAKKEFFADSDAKQEENLKSKETLIQSISDFTLSGNTEEDFKSLKEFSHQWNDIGFVPIKEKDKIWEKYQTALDGQYSKLKVNRDEMQRMRYQSRVDDMMKSGNGENIVRKEKQRLRERIEKVKEEILQYENNLGFFRNADESNPLVKQIRDKIKGLERQSADFKQQLQSFTDSQRAKEAEEAKAEAQAELAEANQAEESTVPEENAE